MAPAKMLVRRGDEVALVDCFRCDSKHHGRVTLATRRLAWVTGPVDYCDPCANCMQEVARTLGVYVAETPLPVPRPPQALKRGIALGGPDPPLPDDATG